MLEWARNLSGVLEYDDCSGDAGPVSWMQGVATNNEREGERGSAYRNDFDMAAKTDEFPKERE